MREIKFRARHKETGEWYYGSSAITDIHQGDDYNLTLSLFWLQVEKGWLDPKTVGQYMGLKGKNGKEIYEGVICLTRGFIVKDGRQTRPEHRFAVEPTIESWYKVLCLNSDGNIEVIGNIYDNPELLEVK